MASTRTTREVVTPIEELRRKLALLSIVMPRSDLAERLGMNYHVLKRFIAGGKKPKGLTMDRVILAWQNYYRIKTLRAEDSLDALMPESVRRAYSSIGQLIDPQFMRYNDAGKLHGHQGANTVSKLVEQYLNNLRIRDEVVTMIEVVQHFRSDEFANRTGTRIAPETTRAAIRRIIGRHPELADYCVPGKRGRKEGSRVLYGKTHRPGSRTLQAAAHLKDD